MNSKTTCITVQIVKFVDGSFPGWVECEFLDADGRKHRVIDKVPAFTDELLDATSAYPQPGIIRCEIVDNFRDDKHCELVRATIARPDGMESTEGVSEFVVLSAQLQPDPWPPSKR